jgi:hypothetical protein
MYLDNSFSEYVIRCNKLTINPHYPHAAMDNKPILVCVDSKAIAMTKMKLERGELVIEQALIDNPRPNELISMTFSTFMKLFKIAILGDLEKTQKLKKSLFNCSNHDDTSTNLTKLKNFLSRHVITTDPTVFKTIKKRGIFLTCCRCKRNFKDKRLLFIKGRKTGICSDCMILLRKKSCETETLIECNEPHHKTIDR